MNYIKYGVKGSMTHVYFTNDIQLKYNSLYGALFFLIWNSYKEHFAFISDMKNKVKHKKNTSQTCKKSFSKL